MAKKLTRIEREMELHPERFDRGDVPADRKIHADQEKRLNDARPQWLKQLVGSKK